MSNILDKIIEKKKEALIELKKNYSSSTIFENIKRNNNNLNFLDKIKINNYEKKISVIAEIKKSSPSAGLIIKEYNPISIAETYFKNGATCLSVLTEEDFFLGNLQHMIDIKNKFKIPILCKDFFIEPYQVSLAKSFGADAILIILACTDNVLAKDLYQTANDLNTSVIVEVHTSKEAESALNYEKAIIGINNRNLKTLKTNVNTTIELYNIISSHKEPLISESGFKSEKDVREIIDKTGIINFLIGESLLNNIDGSFLLKKIVQINQ